MKSLTKNDLRLLSIIQNESNWKKAKLIYGSDCGATNKLRMLKNINYVSRKKAEVFLTKLGVEQLKKEQNNDRTAN